MRLSREQGRLEAALVHAREELRRQAIEHRAAAARSRADHDVALQQAVAERRQASAERDQAIRERDVARAELQALRSRTPAELPGGAEPPKEDNGKDPSEVRFSLLEY